MSFAMPFLLSFFFALLLGPLFLILSKKLKLKQNILFYVKEHESKQGTPTMGGVVFIIPIIIFSLLFSQGELATTLLSMSIFLAYAIVGFLDDFIKIKYNRNLGLSAYQKIIFQLAIALIVAFFVYRNPVFSNLYIPFTRVRFSLGAFTVPFIIFLFLATTNSVNLTDGLDGLAGGTSLVFFFILGIINIFYASFIVQDSLQLQMNNLSIIAFCTCGALLGYLVYNSHPASMFMGDTGSLSLGALVALFCIFSGTSLYIPIIGIMFVLSSVSVILQVLHFKRTRRRIFLMAPFHHHLQHKGMNENKITFIYILITLIIGVVTLYILGVI